MANGNPFYVAPLGGLNLAETFERGYGRYQERQAEERQQDAQQAMLEAWQSGDPTKMADVSMQFPEVSEFIEKQFKFTNTKTREAATDTYRRIISDPANAEKYLTEGISQVQGFRGSPENMLKDLEMFRTDPDKALKNVQMAYSALDPKWTKAQGPKIGTYNPRDYTVESFSEFQRTGDPGVLERYEKAQFKEIGGVMHKLDPTRS